MSKHHLRVVTNSELKTARRCSREHYYMYEAAYRPLGEDEEVLRFGSLIHGALERWWLAEPLDAVIAFINASAADPFEAAKCRAMMFGYDARWEADRALYDVAGVEVAFRAPLVNPETGHASRTFQLGGKLDVLLRRGFVEHKSSGEEIGPGSEYWRRLQLDGQISTYYAGAKALGHEVDGCLYDVLRKPAQRPCQVPLRDEQDSKIVLDATGQRVRTKDGKKWRETGDTAQGYVLQTRPETPEEYEARLVDEIAADPNRYFQRGTVVRLDADERDAQLDAWQQARAIREAELANAHPRNVDACSRYGRTCGFFSVCCGEASIDDPSRYKRVENAHPELTFDTEAAE